MRGNPEHGHARTVTIEQTVDEVQVAGSAAAGANGELSSQMRLGAGRERGNLLVPDVDPRDLSLPADGVGEAIEAVAHDAVDPLHPGGRKSFRELFGNGFHACIPDIFCLVPPELPSFGVLPPRAERIQYINSSS